MAFPNEERTNTYLFKYVYASLIKELETHDEIISVGKKLGERMADDFFVKTEMSRIESDDLDVLLSKIIDNFFMLYLNYSIIVNRENMPDYVVIEFKNFYLLNDVQKDKHINFLMLIRGILESIIQYACIKNKVIIEEFCESDIINWKIYYSAKID